MNLKRINDYLITDGVEQRSKHAAIRLCIAAGHSEEQAYDFINTLKSKIPNLKGANNKFVQGITRWFLSDLDIRSEKDLSAVNTLLYVLPHSMAYDFYDKNFVSELTGKEESFEQVRKVANVETGESNIEGGVHDYDVVRIESYDQALEYEQYAPDWCIFRSEDIYESYLMQGTSHFTFLVRDDMKYLKPYPGDDFPKDAYGLSLLALVVDGNGDVSSVTSRWNDSVNPDNLLSSADLKKLLGSGFHVI